ncbi:hypothetical protein [Staphylococcus haemolyticus]|nr:hypothetical protein [Staphylococcus haemolyticus]
MNELLINVLCIVILITGGVVTYKAYDIRQQQKKRHKKQDSYK